MTKSKTSTMVVINLLLNVPHPRTFKCTGSVAYNKYNVKLP